MYPEVLNREAPLVGYSVWQRSACSSVSKRSMPSFLVRDVYVSGQKSSSYILGYMDITTGRANFNTDVASEFVRDRNASSYIPETTPPPRTTIGLTRSTGGHPPLGPSWNCDTSTSHDVRDTEHERRTGTGGCGGDQETHFCRIATSTARSLTGRPYYLGQSIFRAHAHRDRYLQPTVTSTRHPSGTVHAGGTQPSFP